MEDLILLENLEASLALIDEDFKLYSDLLDIATKEFGTIVESGEILFILK